VPGSNAGLRKNDWQRLSGGMRHIHVGTKDVLQQVDGKDFDGSSVGDDRGIVQYDQAVKVGGGEIQIMNSRNHGEAFRSVKLED
jgi:hypothetical protein